ncbi:type II secretion system protein GspL [Sphingomonas flavalba]|uniref:type II secretion system protein GspL n=1 Tax=Sphingomonas flavalba TaxID=2559804 RepID=UPI00109DBFB2|nr:type II secretion system protein GspL [Sphingomonas flavalba]
MQTPARPIPAPAPPLAPPDAGPRGGLWRLEAGRAVAVDPHYDSSATVLVPTEQVLLSLVPLPLPSRAKRLAALPFALEEQIAEPIDAVHVALGDAVGDGRWLAGVVRHAVMCDWLAQTDAAGLSNAAFVPDALTLPVPGEGRWTVAAAGGRVLVRTADGGGFALAEAGFDAAWQAAGQPGIDRVGADTGVAAPALDLRQGAYAVTRTGLPGWARRLAIIVGVGAAAHLLIAGADLIALKRTAAAARAETAGLIQARAPGAAPADDLIAQASALLPAGGNKAPGRALPLFARLGQALAPVKDAATIETAVLDEAAGTVALGVAAGDPAKLAAVSAALADAGLKAAPGGVTQEGGRMLATVTLRADGAGSGR